MILRICAVDFGEGCNFYAILEGTDDDLRRKVFEEYCVNCWDELDVDVSLDEAKADPVDGFQIYFNNHERENAFIGDIDVSAFLSLPPGTDKDLSLKKLDQREQTESHQIVLEGRVRAAVLTEDPVEESGDERELAALLENAYALLLACEQSADPVTRLHASLVRQSMATAQKDESEN